MLTVLGDERAAKDLIDEALATDTSSWVRLFHAVTDIVLIAKTDTANIHLLLR